MNSELPVIKHIRASIIGENAPIETPFGVKPLIYADYTASGRSLSGIEDYIRDNVLPYYANTHTETSFTGAQTTKLREEARATIAKAINAADDDAIIFCGSGTTAAVHKLISLLSLQAPESEESSSASRSENQKPIVFIGPYEHHSNELPWRESNADVVTIPLTPNGLMDSQALEEALKQYQHRSVKIGSFSAASNVTGLKTDVERVTRLLNRYNALSIWDYAAAAPYVQIDMQGPEPDKTRKHAVLISPHKFIGGPSTPGILAINKNVIKNAVPAVTGGGTVAYVTPESHRYITDPVRREEAGTPGIVESIRAGLVFKTQQIVGTNTIQRLEEKFVRRALDRWSSHANINILGSLKAPRLSIISLQVKHECRDLHYGFIVALLNDLFGIQARGGCSCAGPYAHRLLNLDMPTSRAIERELLKGQMILRPGWVRLNFNYFLSEEIFEYLLSAVELVAQHGWRLLPYYHCDPHTGTWRYQNESVTFKSSLSDFDLLAVEKPGGIQKQFDEHELPLFLEHAKSELLKERSHLSSDKLDLDEPAEALRWFSHPQHIVDSGKLETYTTSTSPK